jgi:hypothetical protein
MEPKIRPPRFTLGDRVKTKDGRVGTVVDFWQAKGTGTLAVTYKFLVRFEKSNQPSVTTTEYFTTLQLRKVQPKCP